MLDHVAMTLEYFWSNKIKTFAKNLKSLINLLAKLMLI